MSAVVKVGNLAKHYGREPNIIKALDGIDMEIQKGFYVLLGASGSGKSTLLNLMGGLDTPTAGYVRIRNTDLSILNQEELAIFRRRNIGFIFRSYNMVPVLNVYENIVLPLELDGRDIDYEYVEQIIKILQLEEKMYQLPHAISRGEQQKAAIARALAAKPAVILADEPTGSLDRRTAKYVIGLLKMTSREFNQAVLINTHDHEIAGMAEQVIHIEDGRIKV